MNSQHRGRILGQNPDKEFSSLLFMVTSTALPWDFYFFKLTQPLTVSTVQLLCTVKEKREKPDRKPYPLTYGIRNTYRNVKSENSQDYAQKPQRNCTFMNLASCPPSFSDYLVTNIRIPNPLGFGQESRSRWATHPVPDPDWSLILNHTLKKCWRRKVTRWTS